MATAEKIENHKAFWAGEGPCLMLVPPGRDMKEMWQVQIYDTGDYRERFYNPEKMWENEMSRARPVLDWPTDGIPTVRPNLGVIFVPSMTGQKYEIREGLMPWCKEPLSAEQIRAARDVDVAKAELMRLAADFYGIHRQRSDGEVAAYQADTQGVFDIAHLLYGDAIFYDMMDESKTGWVKELVEICVNLMVRAVVQVKKLIGEQDNWMIHGHGTEQGVYFPSVGIRISEDSPAMISPEQIERFVMGPIEWCAKRFGGVFMHYCGRHEYFFERLCRCEGVKAIDLGNPEMYDTRWLFELCAETGTVLYSRVAADEKEKSTEDWEGYVRRLAELVKDTGARCVLRPLVFPQGRDECGAMLDLWHELTA
ncbi:MAG TPA: hypothetical protein VMW16_12805 [Sedimentisphaerales bacterium]|nr:hypothetical protein [Sedimentisphaerales bacterium]